MATTHYILGIICSIGIIGHRLPHSNLLIAKTEIYPYKADSADLKRNKLVATARSQLYVREQGKNNFGKQIKVYLAYTNLPEGNPYCAAFVSWVYFKAGYKQPRTAWSPALFPLARQTLNPKPADVLGIYSVKLKRIAHAGLVERRKDNWIISIEGNTNTEGSREGDGVYRKWRHIKTIAKFAEWVR